ncbi:MAG: dihydroorotase [bacterium]
MPTEGFTLSFLYKGFKKIAECGYPALPMIHAEEPFLGDEFKKEALKSNKTDLQKWNDASPAECELVDIFKAAVVAKSLGVPLYVVHVSTGESVDLIRYLKKSGYNIIAETCLHYLMSYDSQDLGVLGKVKPPIRSEANRQKIWEGVLDGTLTVIGTDTVPYTRQQKEVEFWSAPYGAGSGIGLLLPIMFSEGFIKRRMTLDSLAQILSENPAKAFGMYPQKGCIAEGFDADIVVVDPEKEFTVISSNLRCASDFSIYEGLKIKGLPVKTYLRGKLVASDGTIVATLPEGQFIHGLKPFGPIS